MSNNKKIWYGDNYPKSILEDAVTPPTTTPGPEDGFTFDRNDIKFSSNDYTFDMN